MQSQESFLDVLLDTVGALVVVLDRDGRIVEFNRACESVTGYTADETRGEFVWDRLLLPEEIAPVKAVFQQLRAGEFPNRHENYWCTRDGVKRRIAWSNTAILDEAGAVKFVIGTGLDVTGERAAQDRARVAENLAAFATLGASVVHEIKNPLNAAVLQLSLLQKRLSAETPDLDASRATAALVSTELQRLGRLLEEFLQFARPRPPRRTPTDLAMLAEQVVVYCRPESASHDVTLVIAATPSVVDVDRDQLRQVLINLVLNAIQASPRGAAVKIEVTSKDGQAILAVDDAGPGVPDPPEALFQPFFSTKPGGTGLGLAIAHRIVRDHGGDLRVDSRPGRTTFSVHLPIESDANPSS